MGQTSNQPTIASTAPYYTCLPDWILDADITPNAIRLYLVLYRYTVQSRSRSGLVFPSRRKLAEQVKVKTPETVDRLLRELIGIGAVTKEAQYAPAGDRTSNTYWIHDRPYGQSIIEGGEIDHVTPAGSNERPPLDESSDGDSMDQAVTITEGEQEPKGTTTIGDDRRSSPEHIASDQDPPQKAKPRKPRPRDLVFEQIVWECYQTDHTNLTESELGRVRRARKELGRIGASAEDVRIRAYRYQRSGLNGSLTPQTLTKMWNQLGKERIDGTGSGSDPASQVNGNGSADFGQHSEKWGKYFRQPQKP